MAATEKRLKQLESYKGTNPTPEDFDEFWRERVQEAYEKPLVYTIEQSEILGCGCCDFFDLWFSGMRGDKIHCKYIRPKGDTPLPIVLQFHGYPGATRGWAEYSSFAGMGFAHLSMDCPGQGGRSEDGCGYVGTTAGGHIVMGLPGVPEDMYYVKTFQDTCLLARLTEELPGIDRERVYVNGASQGGGIGIVCAALNPDIVKKAAILYPFLSDYRRVWELDADVAAYEGLRYYSRWFNAQGERTDEMFYKLGYIDAHNFAHLVRAEVLFGTGLLDEVCPIETQYAVYNCLTCKKRHVFFPDFAHEEIQAFDDLLFSFFGEGEGD